jgi:hypothetical protein
MLVILLKIYIGYCIFRKVFLYVNSLIALHRVEDKLTRKLWFAASLGMTKRMDKLIKKGADVNYQIKHKANKNMTGLSWLLLRHHHTILIKRGFEHLLKKGADPFVLNLPTTIQNYRISIMQYTAKLQRSFFLRKILEITKPKSEFIVGFDKYETSMIEEAADANMPDNFKLLLDYTKENCTKEQQQEMFRRLLSSLIVIGWDYICYWVEKGLDYSVKEKKDDKKIFLIKILEEGLPPASVIDFNGGIDWVDKIWTLLEKRGEKVNVKVTEDLSYYQKYIIKNGKRVLIVRPKKKWSQELKSKRWRPYTHTLHYWIETKLASNRTRMMITRILLTCKRV